MQNTGKIVVSHGGIRVKLQRCLIFSRSLVIFALLRKKKLPPAEYVWCPHLLKPQRLLIFSDCLIQFALLIQCISRKKCASGKRGFRRNAR